LWVDLAAELTKAFAFSASFSAGTRAIGRNYILLVTVEALEESRERLFEECVQKELISRVHSRDLTSQVDFLKGVEMTDASLLAAFWKRLASPLADYRPKRFALQRDTKTVTTLYAHSL